MFHVENGLYFERIVSPALFGSVKIIKKDERGLVVFEQMMSPEAWASVAASMTQLGENGTTFRMFLALQK